MTTIITPGGVTTTEHRRCTGDDHAAVSGVSWGAIIAGAAAAAALSLILLVLGAGLGFSAASPWTCELGHRRRDRRRRDRLDHLHLDRRLRARRLPGRAPAPALDQRARRRGLLPRHRARPPGLGDRDAGHGGRARPRPLTTLAGGAAQAGGAALKGAATAAAAGGAIGGAARRCRERRERWRRTGDAVLRRHPVPRRHARPPPIRTMRRRAPKPLRIFVADIRAGSMGPGDVRYLGQVVSRKTGLAPGRCRKARRRCVHPGEQGRRQRRDQGEARSADEARKAAAYSVALDVRRPARRRLLRQPGGARRRPPAATTPTSSEAPASTLQPASTRDRSRRSPGGSRHAFHSAAGCSACRSRSSS